MTNPTAAEVMCCPTGCEKDARSHKTCCAGGLAGAVENLHAAGYMIVPRDATLGMKRAANKSVAIVTPDGTWAIGLDEAQRAYRAMTVEGELK